MKNWRLSLHIRFHNTTLMASQVLSYQIEDAVKSVLGSCETRFEEHKLILFPMSRFATPELALQEWNVSKGILEVILHDICSTTKRYLRPWVDIQAIASLAPPSEPLRSCRIGLPKDEILPEIRGIMTP